MDKTASQLFREFLAHLLPDNEVAILVRDALDILSPDGDDEGRAADSLSIELDNIATEVHHQLLIEDAQHPQQPLNFESLS